MWLAVILIPVCLLALGSVVFACFADQEAVAGQVNLGQVAVRTGEATLTAADGIGSALLPGETVAVGIKVVNPGSVDVYVRMTLDGEWQLPQQHSSRVEACADYAGQPVIASDTLVFHEDLGLG